MRTHALSDQPSMANPAPWHELLHHGLNLKRSMAKGEESEDVSSLKSQVVEWWQVLSSMTFSAH